MNKFIKWALYIVGLFFFTCGVYYGKVFLAPLALAGIIAILIFPLSAWFESKGMGRSLASLTITFISFLVSLGFGLIIGIQINNIVDKWSSIEKNMGPKIEQLSTYIVTHSPIKKAQIDSYIEKNPMSSLFSKNEESSGLSYVSDAISFVGEYILTFIYIFFFIRFRKKFVGVFKEYINPDNKNNLENVIANVVKAVQGYLVGKLKLIGLLIIFYGIGLGVSGVNNFIMVSIIAAVLTIIPYIGNMIGMGLALVFGYLTQGDTSVLVGILITFTIVQFAESYILQPYVIGSEVNLNPFFIILSVILGNILWGITGMVIAIPVLAIIKILFKTIPTLHPIAHLIEKKE